MENVIFTSSQYPVSNPQLPMNPAIFFEPDGYVLPEGRLMGRHAAGNAFLRAAVAGREDGPMWAYTPRERSAEVFRRLVHSFDGAVETRWIPAQRLDLLELAGTLYLPGPDLDDAAFLRLRRGVRAYSICGVTHTTSSHRAMDSITTLLRAPVMEWDALICTSHAVRETVGVLLEAEREYLQWRFGPSVGVRFPKLPVIPLGVHCRDFRFGEAERAAARRDLGVGDDAVVALFAGRLSFHAKAHPHAMFVALERAAEASGREIVLVQSGWFSNEHIEQAFSSGAALFCPGVRVVHADGRQPRERRRSWAAADLFVSLSDNIQETFGLTPVEAMAAGLPSVVSDWNGYKDTVRDGVDGFRIATCMPESIGEHALAQGYESGAMGYDTYCGYACQMVSIDTEALVLRIGELCVNRELRLSMGASARRRAEEVFSWQVVYDRYRELWRELEAVRGSGSRDAPMMPSGAPVCSAARMDPFRAFRHYSSSHIGRESWVMLAPGATVERYRELVAHPLFGYASVMLLQDEAMVRFFGLLGGERVERIEKIAFFLGVTHNAAVRAVAMLKKMGLVVAGI